MLGGGEFAAEELQVPGASDGLYIQEAPLVHPDGAVPHEVCLVSQRPSHGCCPYHYHKGCEGNRSV